MLTLEKYSQNHIDGLVDFVKEFQTSDEFGMMGILDIALEHYKIDKKYNDLSEEELKQIFPKYVEFVGSME